MSSQTRKHALVLGASRGLGLVLVEELLVRGWVVTATYRQNGEALKECATRSHGRLMIESLEVTSAVELAALRQGLGAVSFDLLFVNAAINRGDDPIEEVQVETFNEVMVTNAFSPLRALATLRDLVAPGGTVAVMSSEQGSISRNDENGFELYKASKAALNQLMRSYATRHIDDGHTKLLIDPGHNRTSLGGPNAPLVPEESIRGVVDVLETRAGEPGLQFLDRHGNTVPW